MKVEFERARQDGKQELICCSNVTKVQTHHGKNDMLNLLCIWEHYCCEYIGVSNISITL